jgi:hypothetical protein
MWSQEIHPPSPPHTQRANLVDSVSIWVRWGLRKSGHNPFWPGIWEGCLEEESLEPVLEGPQD